MLHLTTVNILYFIAGFMFALFVFILHGIYKLNKESKQFNNLVKKMIEEDEKKHNTDAWYERQREIKEIDLSKREP